MESTFIVGTDKKEKIKLESGIISASWISPIAYGGFEAKFEVKTVFVAEGSTIEVKGKSSKGKAPDTVKGKVFNNTFNGSLLIPDKVAPDADIWFEAKLPKHGLKMESNIIPARPSIGVKKLCWDRKEVKRDDIVTLTCQFESGVINGEEAVFIIYEHNPDSCDFKVVSIPAEVKANKAEIQWQFNCFDDTLGIATEEVKKAIGKSYVHPQYYFVVGINGQRAGEKMESGLLKFIDSIEFSVKSQSGRPVVEKEFKLLFANGEERTGKLDAEGKAKIEDVPPGPYRVMFENINPDPPEGSGAGSSESGGVSGSGISVGAGFEGGISGSIGGSFSGAAGNVQGAMSAGIAVAGSVQVGISAASDIAAGIAGATASLSGMLNNVQNNAAGAVSGMVNLSISGTKNDAEKKDNDSKSTQSGLNISGSLF